jgi:hypothetical protein
MSAALALVLVTLHGPDSQPIEVNPDAVVSLRAPREKLKNAAAGTKCVLDMGNGKLISVVEDCDAARQLMGNRP